MEFLKKNARTLTLFGLIALAIVAIFVFSDDSNDNSDNQTANNQATEQTPSEETESKPDEDGIVKKDNTSSVTVVEGDSQTTVVRRMVGKYLEDNDKTLNDAQKLHAETKLVDLLGRNDLILVGQTISLTDTQIKQVIDASSALTAEEQALWSQYL